MHLSRYGFNVATLAWLGTLILFVDIPGNTMNTGDVSKLFFFKTLLDAMLILWTLGMLFAGSVTTASAAKAKISVAGSDIVDFQKLSTVEYIYFAIICVYGLANLYFHYQMNSDTTGFTSLVTLGWSFFDLAVAALSGIQFYQMMQGTIVRVTKQLVNN